MISLMLWNALAQIEMTGALNWPVIIGILVVLVILVLAIAIPSRKALKSSKEIEAADLKDDDSAKDKGKLSLVELKEAKRAQVSGDKSKEEMRDLRKERRAATQTGKALERLESGDTASALDGVVGRDDADTGDVFASLFGGGSSEKLDLSFDDMSESSSAPRHSFPTLGSALIPLSDFSDDGEAKEKESESELDPLDELTQRLTAKVEKKKKLKRK